MNKQQIKPLDRSEAGKLLQLWYHRARQTEQEERRGEATNEMPVEEAPSACLTVGSQRGKGGEGGRVEGCGDWVRDTGWLHMHDCILRGKDGQKGKGEKGLEVGIESWRRHEKALRYTHLQLAPLHDSEIWHREYASFDTTKIR